MGKEIKGQGIPFDPIDQDLESKKEPVLEELKKESGQPEKPTAAKSNSRIVVIMLVIFAVFSLSTAVALYVMKEKETSARLDLESKMERLKIEKTEVEKELQDTVLVKRQLENDLQVNKENYRLMLAQYQDQQAQNEKLTAEFNEKLKVIESLQSGLEKAERDNQRFNEKLAKMNQEYDDIKQQLGQIRMAKEALENRILQLNRKRMESSVELEKIVVGEGKPAAAAVSTVAAEQKPEIVPLGPAAHLEGQILVVNREFAFVVVNIGEKDGIKDAQVLDVFRGQKFLGKVQVERVYDTMSSAVILPEATKQELKEGDIVKLI